MATSAQQATSPQRRSNRDPFKAVAFQVAITVPMVISVALILGFMPSRVAHWEILFWIGVIGLVELLPVQGWRGLQMTVAEPLLTAVGILYSPPTALVVAFLASLDIREFRREISLLRTLFNRSQVALAAFCSSSLFHLVSNGRLDWPRLLLGAMASAVVGYAVNTALVSGAASLIHSKPITSVLTHLRLGRFRDFLWSVPAFGLLGALLAKLFLEVKGAEWAVVAFLCPLLLIARRMFTFSEGLQAETARVREREAAFRALSERIAGDRHEERLAIGAVLHDEVVQSVLHLNLAANTGIQYLHQDRNDRVYEVLNQLRSGSADVMAKLRDVVANLQRSPLGPEGFAGALEDLGRQLSHDHRVVISSDVRVKYLPASVEQLLYQVAREALTNAALHARASQIWLVASLEAGWLALEVRDNGGGFIQEDLPTNHFGLRLMRERASALGAELNIETRKGHGTSIRLRCRAHWLE